MNVIVHGYSSYSRGICKCPTCTEAARGYRRKQRAKRLRSPDFMHGRRASYDCGCRCTECRKVRKLIYETDERVRVSQ